MQTTESFGRGNVGQTITASQTVPFDLTVSYIPTNDNQFITASPDTNNEEIFRYTTSTGTAGGAGVLTITGRGYNKHNSTQDVANNREHDINSIFKLANNHIILNEKVDKTDLVSVANGEGASTIGVEDSVGHFIATDVEAALAELAVGAPGVADASITVAGKVEEATDAEFTAGTDVGGTGATLFSTLVQTIKSISLKGLITTTAEADEFVINQGGVDKRISQTNIREELAASATLKGMVELATDTEVIAGVDTTRYANLVQIDNNYGVAIEAGTTYLLGEANTVRSNLLGSWVKQKEIEINAGGTYTTSFDAGTSIGGGSSNDRRGEYQIYKNGVAFGTLRTNTVEVGSEVTYTEDLTFASGDLMQLYSQKTGTVDGSKSAKVLNFNAKYSIGAFNKYTGTVNLD